MADAAVTPDDVTGADGSGVAAEAADGPPAADSPAADGADKTGGAEPTVGGDETKVDTAKADPIDVHPPKWFERGTYRALYLLLTLIGKVWLRVEIVGRDNVPKNGPFVLAPVHRSNIDFLLVALIRPNRMRYMGKASIWKYKWLGRFFTMLGAFPVHRGTADRASLRTCMQVIEYGEPLVMFPEGTRREGPKVQEVFDGTAYVAARAGVPLVPVGIGGSEEAMPKGSKFIKPHKVVLVVGEPIPVPKGDGSGRVPRRVIRELSELLHESVQSAFDEARRRAGTA